MTRQEEKIKQLVGVNNDGEIVMCDDIFKYSDGFKGATGSIFEVLNKEKADRINELVKDGDYGYEDLWRECVSAGQTTDGLYEWCESVVYNEVDIGGQDFVGQDTSYLWTLKQLLNELSDETIQKMIDFINENNMRNDDVYFESVEDFKENAVFSCVGGGRCFSSDEELPIIFDNDLLEKIKKVETPEEKKMKNKKK